MCMHDNICVCIQCRPLYPATLLQLAYIGTELSLLQRYIRLAALSLHYRDRRSMYANHVDLYYRLYAISVACMQLRSHSPRILHATARMAMKFKYGD